MCGICGFVTFDNHNCLPGQEIIRRMLKTLYHRGPDEEGLFVDNNIGLGIRRLSIIDLERGKQPIFNEDGTICVVCNGEIYNFHEWRTYLEDRGHSFNTNSDIEIIPHLYEELNVEFVKKLEGMFALALWDSHKKTFILARDRFGIKPLYYTEYRDNLIFSSELKAILVFPGINREIDFASLDRYLTFEYVPGPNSIFKGINKFPSAHILTIGHKQRKIISYWKPNCIPFHNYSRSEYSEKFHYLLKSSIEKHLISDVPIGVFLSGGIDSSTIVYMLSKLNNKTRTFSISFKENSFDESRFARQVSCVFNTEHHEANFAARDMQEIIPEIKDFLDEPFADASIFPTYFLSKMAKSLVKVVLSGEGGDEMFIGYPTYQAHLFANYYEAMPYFIRKYLEKVILNLPVSMNNLSLDYKAKRFVTGLNYTLPLRHLVWMGAFTPEEKKALFRKEIWELISQEDSFQEVKGLWESLKPDRNNLIPCIQQLDINTYLRDDLLVKADIAGMSASLEVRVPFLDHHLAEFCLSLPQDLLFKGLNLKFFLKKEMDGYLPREIIRRGKKGFGIPLSIWINEELKPFILDMLAEPRIRREGLFNYSFIERILKEHFSHHKDNRKLIWALVMFELWYDNLAKLNSYTNEA